MQLYNTLTRDIEDISPIDPSKTTIYTCGPTVYDYPHVGNWFTFIRYDLLVRTLKVSGKNPVWVMNITDVGHLVSDADEGEDKLEKGAKREGKTAWDIAKYYSDYFIEGLRRLNITKPDYLPKATEHIEEQIALIKTLEDKGYTYVINDGVYYDTSKFEGYAAFARLDLDDLQAGARVEHNPEKRNASDFALWKFSPKDHKRDMEWDSPWGKGFPGWHIECSAMAIKYLGETIDIHSGGIDHIPVHHTNEIAQSEAATGKRFANYWMHTNHITINDEKISKSLGNSITLEDIEKQGFSLEAFRLHVLESHYRSQSKFSWEALEAAQNRLTRWKSIAILVHQDIDSPLNPDLTSPGQHARLGLEGGLRDLPHIILRDLDTPHLLFTIDGVLRNFDNMWLARELKSDFVKFLKLIENMLGIHLLDQPDVSNEQRQLIQERERYRQVKNWQKSDELRKQLEQQNIGLRDTDQGTIWYWLS